MGINMFSSIGSFEPDLFWVFVLAVLVAVLLTRRKADQHQRPRDATISMAPLFIIQPYLQLGNEARLSARETVEVLWHTKHNERKWQVQVRGFGESDWRNPVDVAGEPVDIAKLGEHVRFRAQMRDLEPGKEFEYRLLADGAIAFGATGKARSNSTQPFTFAAVGDLGKPHSGNIQQVAHQISVFNPDFLAVPGDIVYERGRVSEYMENLFPVYNADKAAPGTGAPLMRQRITMPALGNHDAALPGVKDKRDFAQWADLLGYFIFWSVPMNGPQRKDAPNTPIIDGGDSAVRERFLKAAGDRYPRIGCYFFDWGNMHVTVLDSNAYVNWTDRELIDWVEKDLATARYATWRIVIFHHPAFSSDGKHAEEQRMRLLAPVFERWSVDLVISGHNHCYERSRPMRFAPDKHETVLHSEECAVAGGMQIDREYDGRTNTTPNGVIYLVDGAGGAKIYPHSKPAELKEFTQVYDQSAYSFTYFKVNRTRLEAYQISASGNMIDSYVITKN
jgi:3',5'-cyclic AMP phosphodiesterase CpdA